ncbi:MAG: 5'-3' exonuclease H3TH domain-containing protein [Thermoanaerobaculia bacterium]
MTTYLIDASPYIFRAHFSMPSSLVDPEGRPAGATYGFASFLLKLLAQEQLSHLAVAFDRSLTTSFRNELYPEYKAKRETPPEELVSQVENCRRVAECLGMATFIDDSYEADDLIGTLSTLASGAGQKSVIVTSDKDLAQLVSESVTLLDFARETRYSTPEVEEKFGVHPEQITDLLALAGDAVDNIPGVRGIGNKTAVALLQAFGNLETVYERLDEVEGLPIRGAASVKAKLESDRERAFLSKELATIYSRIPLDVTFEDLAYRGANRECVEALFQELGFDRIRNRIKIWQ